MPEPSTVVVVGAGQAGLAVSHELQGAGVDHVVLERDRVGERWRTRWESFCLVTPNWTVLLPGAHYTSWVDVPGAFDAFGFPLHDGCASTAAPGLWFAGVHFLRTRKSSLVSGVGEDAAIVARGIAAAG